MQELSTEISSSAISPPTLQISDSAARRIVTLLSDEPAGTKFRVAILGGGCSGFQYKFELDAVVNEDDHIFEKDGARVIADEISLGLLANSELHYVEDLGSAGFEMRNPQAKASCGCGNSFSV